MSPLPTASPISGMMSMTLNLVLQQLGITGEDAVRLIDAFSQRGIVIGYLVSDEPEHQLYSCRSIHPELPPECRTFEVRIPKRKGQ